MMQGTDRSSTRKISPYKYDFWEERTSRVFFNDLIHSDEILKCGRIGVEMDRLSI